MRRLAAIPAVSAAGWRRGGRASRVSYRRRDHFQLRRTDRGGRFSDGGRAELRASRPPLLATARQRDLETLPQAFVEIVHLFEVFSAIVLRLTHLADVDQVEDNLPKVAGRMDTPVVQDRLGHQAKLIHRIVADRLTQLLAGQVLILARLLFQADVLGCLCGSHLKRLVRIAKRLEDKNVCIERITPVAPEQLGKRMGRIKHGIYSSSVDPGVSFDLFSRLP